MLNGSVVSPRTFKVSSCICIGSTVTLHLLSGRITLYLWSEGPLIVKLLCNNVYCKSAIQI